VHRALRPSVCPPNGSVTRPLPSLLTGCLGCAFPACKRYDEGMKTSRVPPVRFVAFAWRYRSLHSGVALSRMPEASSTSLGLGQPGCPCRQLGAEINGISHVPREPPEACALLSDPGRSVPTTPVQWVDVPPAAMTTEAPATWPSFEAQSPGFCTRCLRFVPPLLTTTQDVLPVGGEPLPGGSGYPLGSVDRFHTSTRYPPLLGFAWRDTASASCGHSA
jgi:hypothetical protein